MRCLISFLTQFWKCSYILVILLSEYYVVGTLLYTYNVYKKVYKLTWRTLYIDEEQQNRMYIKVSTFNNIVLHSITWKQVFYYENKIIT